MAESRKKKRLGRSRRRFFKAVATTVAWYPMRTLSCLAEAPSPRERLFPFGYSDTKLTGGPLKAQFDRLHAWYRALDEDRVLKVYRQRAGLTAPGKDMGGWYDAEGYVPGHSLGQYISAMARFAAATGDAETRAKVKRLVDGFAATISSDGYCYASLRASTWAPAYIIDKHMIGLLDAYQFTGLSSALEVLERAVNGALRYLPPRAVEWAEAPKHAPNDESYTLPENFLYAYELSGNRNYLDLAKKYFSDDGYFDPLARGVNVLPGLHAYSHVNALSSAARGYLVLGELKYLQTLRNAWDMIEETQRFASGGWAPDEFFVEPNKGKLGESLRATHQHFETPCGSYAFLKLARYLLRTTGEARYGDGLERVLYNTVLGAKDPGGDGLFYYHSDYHSSTQKSFHRGKWHCCSGTLPRVVSDYLVSSYFQGGDGIYVNLFTPSQVEWKIRGVLARLIQTTSYPESESTELRIEIAAPEEFAVHVRIPGWLRSPAAIAVNEKITSVPAEPGTFAAIRRRWQNNDTIQITFAFSLRAEAIDRQHPNTVALMRGPLMLVAVDPVLKLPRRALSSPDSLKQIPYARQTLELSLPASTQQFKPFYLVQDEAYTTYLSLESSSS